MARSDKYVTVSGIAISDDTASELAYWITLDDGSRVCIPYSVTKARHITHTKGSDSIEIERWFADKEELDHDD